MDSQRSLNGSQKSLLENPLTKILEQRFLAIPGANFQEDIIGTYRGVLLEELDCLSKAAVRDADDLLLADVAMLVASLQQPAIVIDKDPQEIKATKSPIPARANPMPLKLKIGEIEAMLVALKDFPALKTIYNALAEIQVTYIQWMEKFSNATPEIKQSMLTPRAEITGDCLGFYYIDHATALELMCRDKYGFARKQNLYGNHAVVAKGGLHFKPNPKALDFVGPAEEYAVHSFGENLLSITSRVETKEKDAATGLLTAPTMLLKISNVEITRVSKKKTPPEHYRAFVDAIVSGKSPEQVLSDPELSRNLVRVRRLASSVVQAGLSIEGILLQHILELVQFFETCKSQMSNEAFRSALAGFRGDCYRAELFKDYPHFNRGSETNQSQLMEVFLGFSAMHPVKSRLIDFQELDGPDQRRIHRFNKLMALSADNIVTSLAIIKKWPLLMEGRYLSDIARIPQICSLFDKLYPTKTIDQIIEEVPQLLRRIEPFNFTASFTMQLLLHPEDAKADNFMVEVVPDHLGNVRLLRIVGIDNDRAFKPALKINKAGNFFTGIKSVLLCMPNIADSIDSRFRAEFLKQPPEVLLVNWLRELNDQNKRYARLEILGVLTEKDKFEKGSQRMTKALDIPIRLPTTVLLKMYDSLRAMHRILFREALITHNDLFQRIEPLVHFYYQNFRQKFPLDFINAIYHGDWIAVPPESIAAGNSSAPVMGTRANPLVKSPEGQGQGWNEPLEVSIQTFLRSVDMRECSASAAQSIISTVSSNFPEVTRMEVTQSQLDSFLEISLRRPELDVPLVTMLLKLGGDPRLTMPKGGSLVALLLQRRPLPISLLRRVTGMAAVSQDIEKNGFLIGQVLLEVMAAAAKGAAGDVSSRDADLVFDMLLRAGLDLDSVAGEPPAEQETLLDRAVRLDLPHAFALLVLRGASRCIRLAETMPFAERYSASTNNDEALRRDMTEAIKILLRANPSFSWELSLRLMKAAKGTEGALTINAFLDGSCGGELIVRPDVSARILGCAPTESYTLVHSTHFGQAVFASWNSVYPLLELSLVRFQKRIFGQSHLQIDLCRVLGKENKVLVLSNHLEAQPMRAFISDEGGRRALSQHIDMRTYSELVLTHALLAQGANVDDLYVCSSASSLSPPTNRSAAAKEATSSNSATKWPLLVRTNTPQLHGSALRRRGNPGELILAVRNYLYCMDEMRQPVDANTRKTILKLKPGKAMAQWLNEILALQEKAEDIFKGVGGATFLFMPCAHEVISTELHERLSHLQDILASEDANIALLDVLFRMNSIVGLAYHSVHRLLRSPEDRYQYLCSTPLDKVLEENLQLTQELELQLPLRQALTLVSASDHRSHTRCDLKHAILCSNSEQMKSREVREAVAALAQQPPDISLFANLSDKEDLKQRAIARVSLANWPEDQLRPFIDLLGKCSAPLKSICLFAASSLEAEMLLQSQLVKSERAAVLRELVITFAPKLDVSRLLSELSKKCANIERIRILRCGADIQQYSKLVAMNSSGGAAAKTKSVMMGPGTLIRGAGSAGSMEGSSGERDDGTIRVFRGKNKDDEGGGWKFLNLKLLILEECNSIEILRMVCPELRIIELNHLERLSWMELTSKEGMGNFVPLINLFSFNMKNCPNVPPTHIELVVAAAPSLKAYRVASQKQMPSPRIIANYFCEYKNWTPINIHSMTLNGILDLSGSNVSENQLTEMSRMLTQLASINLSSCPNISVDSVATLIAKCPTLNKIIFVEPDEIVKSAAAHSTVNAIKVLPTGRIITAIDDNSIRVWEPNPITDELVERISVSKLHSDVVQTFEPLPFGCIATGSADKTVGVSWINYTEQLENIRKLKGHEGAVLAMKFLPDQTLITAGRDRVVRQWDMVMFRLARVISEDVSTPVLSLEHLPAPHNLLLGGTEGGIIYAWPLDNPKDCTLLTDHGGYPSGLGPVHVVRALHRDVLASGGGPDGMIRLWTVVAADTVSASSTTRLCSALSHGGAVRGIDRLPLNRFVSIGDCSVRIWDLTTGACLISLLLSRKPLSHLGLMPNGRLLTASEDHFGTSTYPKLFGVKKRGIDFQEFDPFRKVTFTVEVEGNQVAATFAELPGAVFGPTGTVATCMSLLTELTRLVFGHVIQLPSSSASAAIGATANLGNSVSTSGGLSGVGPGHAISVRVELPTRQMFFTTPANQPLYARVFLPAAQRLTALLESIHIRYCGAVKPPNKAEFLKSSNAALYPTASSPGGSQASLLSSSSGATASSPSPSNPSPISLSSNNPSFGSAVPIYGMIPPPAVIPSTVPMQSVHRNAPVAGTLAPSARLVVFPSQVFAAHLLTPVLLSSFASTFASLSNPASLTLSTGNLANNAVSSSSGLPSVANREGLTMSLTNMPPTPTEQSLSPKGPQSLAERFRMLSAKVREIKADIKPSAPRSLSPQKPSPPQATIASPPRAVTPQKASPPQTAAAASLASTPQKNAHNVNYTTILALTSPAPSTTSSAPVKPLPAAPYAAMAPVAIRSPVTSPPVSPKRESPLNAPERPISPAPLRPSSPALAQQLAAVQISSQAPVSPQLQQTTVAQSQPAQSPSRDLRTAGSPATFLPAHIKPQQRPASVGNAEESWSRYRPREVITTQQAAPFGVGARSGSRDRLPPIMGARPVPNTIHIATSPSLTADTASTSRLSLSGSTVVAESSSSSSLNTNALSYTSPGLRSGARAALLGDLSDSPSSVQTISTPLSPSLSESHSNSRAGSDRQPGEVFVSSPPPGLARLRNAPSSESPLRSAGVLSKLPPPPLPPAPAPTSLSSGNQQSTSPRFDMLPPPPPAPILATEMSSSGSVSPASTVASSISSPPPFGSISETLMRSAAALVPESAAIRASNEIQRVSLGQNETPLSAESYEQKKT